MSSWSDWQLTDDRARARALISRWVSMKLTEWLTGSDFVHMPERKFCPPASPPPPVSLLLFNDSLLIHLLWSEGPCHETLKPQSWEELHSWQIFHNSAIYFVTNNIDNVGLLFFLGFGDSIIIWHWVIHWERAVFRLVCFWPSLVLDVCHSSGITFIDSEIIEIWSATCVGYFRGV